MAENAPVGGWTTQVRPAQNTARTLTGPMDGGFGRQPLTAKNYNDLMHGELAGEPEIAHGRLAFKQGQNGGQGVAGVEMPAYANRDAHTRAAFVERVMGRVNKNPDLRQHASRVEFFEPGGTQRVASQQTRRP